MMFRRFLIVAPIVAAAIVLWFALREAGQPLSGPQPVAWDHEACAQCRMLVGEPAFAAQIVEPERALHFDDPGCLFAYLAGGAPKGELWFHHGKEDRWVRDAWFVTGAHTPMGYGLAAVDKGSAGSIPLEEARRQATARAP